MKFSTKLSALFLATAALTAAPLAASAGGIGYESSVTTKISSPVNIEVKLSDDLAHRANNLPEKLRDRSSSSRLNSGFANNGFYGDKELTKLTERLEEKVEQRFEKVGLSVADEAPVKLVLTLEDARPNRPTFEQLSREPGLSFQSFGIGGAEITGELFDTEGNSLGTVEYRWFENDIRDARFGGTWTDANRAISRFAKRVSKDLT
jgi:hypothetical protein